MYGRGRLYPLLLPPVQRVGQLCRWILSLLYPTRVRSHPRHQQVRQLAPRQRPAAPRWTAHPALLHRSRQLIYRYWCLQRRPGTSPHWFCRLRHSRPSCRSRRPPTRLLFESGFQATQTTATASNNSQSPRRGVPLPLSAGPTGLLPWDSSKKILKEAKVSSHEVHGCNLPCCPATASFNTELYNLIAPIAKAAPNPHIIKAVLVG
ncbi:unnamed protein product [Coccothraustes coccothraustes]